MKSSLLLLLGLCALVACQNEEDTTTMTTMTKDEMTTMMPTTQEQLSSDPQAEPEPETEPESEPKAEPEPSTEPKAEPEPSSEPQAEPEPSSEPEAEPEPASEPESSSDSTSEPFDMLKEKATKDQSETPQIETNEIIKNRIGGHPANQVRTAEQKDVRSAENDATAQSTSFISLIICSAFAYGMRV